MIPGLVDGHLHDAGGGPGVDLSGARSIADILAAVAARVKQSGPDDVIVSNSDWHEAQLKEHRLPYRADLDTVAPANPVVLVRGGHEYILNSAALRKWRINKETPQQPGGRITRDAKGELNGELIDRAKALVQLPPSQPLTIEALIEQHKKLNAAGLTSIRYPGAPIEQYRLLAGDEAPRPADDPRQPADARRRPTARRRCARRLRRCTSSPTKATSGCASAA